MQSRATAVLWIGFLAILAVYSIYKYYFGGPEGFSWDYLLSVALRAWQPGLAFAVLFLLWIGLKTKSTEIAS